MTTNIPLVQLTQTDIDSLTNVPEGTELFNSTAKQNQIRIGTNWKPEVDQNFFYIEDTNTIRPLPNGVKVYNQFDQATQKRNAWPDTSTTGGFLTLYEPGIFKIEATATFRKEVLGEIFEFEFGVDFFSPSGTIVANRKFESMDGFKISGPTGSPGHPFTTKLASGGLIFNTDLITTYNKIKFYQIAYTQADVTTGDAFSGKFYIEKIGELGDSY
jgi:hypothetical protein